MYVCLCIHPILTWWEALSTKNDPSRPLLQKLSESVYMADEWCEINSNVGKIYTTGCGTHTTNYNDLFTKIACLWILYYCLDIVCVIYKLRVWGSCVFRSIFLINEEESDKTPDLVKFFERIPIPVPEKLLALAEDALKVRSFVPLYHDNINSLVTYAGQSWSEIFDTYLSYTVISGNLHWRECMQVQTPIDPNR